MLKIIKIIIIRTFSNPDVETRKMLENNFKATIFFYNIKNEFRKIILIASMIKIENI